MSASPYEMVRAALETEFDQPLTTRAEVMRAYGRRYGLSGAVLEEEFGIAVGEIQAGAMNLGLDGTVTYDEPTGFEPDPAP